MTNSFLQIGSWNIEHLSKEGGRRESPYALTDHIEMSGVDILAVQEIYVTHMDGDNRRNKEIDTVCKLLQEHLQQDWRYELFPNRNSGDKSQLCGVMWNNSIVEKTSTLKIEVPHQQDGLSLWDRTPHAAKFTTAVDIWQKNSDGVYEKERQYKSVIIISLHMKSNYGGASHGKRVRSAESEVLVKQLDHVMATLDDESLILIGDTNILGVHEPAINMFENAGLSDLNAADSITYPGYGGSPFDRAFVALGRREFVYSRQYVLQAASSGEHDKFLSDHYMIKISVKIYVDDADPRTN